MSSPTLLLRVRNALAAALGSAWTLADVSKLTWPELLRIPRIGPKGLQNLSEVLIAEGYDDCVKKWGYSHWCNVHRIGAPPRPPPRRLPKRGTNRAFLSQPLQDQIAAIRHLAEIGSSDFDIACVTSLTMREVKSIRVGICGVTASLYDRRRRQRERFAEWSAQLHRSGPPGAA